MTADITYNIPQLFQAAFGISSPVFITPAFRRQVPEGISYKGIETLPDYYPSSSRSWMGTPILFAAQFKGDTYNRYKANGEIEKIAMSNLVLPPATMFSFRRAHNITRTEVLGSNGTVKEIYGFDDWVIDVRGLCLDEPTKSAEEQLKELLEWEKLADSFRVSGQLFAQHEITQATMADWSDNVQQGRAGVISFQFQLYSDEDIDLTT